MTILSQESKDKGWKEEFPTEEGWYWAYEYTKTGVVKPLCVTLGASPRCSGRVRVYGTSNTYELGSHFKNYVWLPIAEPDKPELDHANDNPKPETSTPSTPKLKCPHFPGCGPCELHRCKFYKHYEKDYQPRGRKLIEAGHYCKKGESYGRMNKLEEQ